MFNLYVYSQSFVGATVEDVENSLKELNEIVENSGESENFWKDEESLYDVKIAGGENLSQIIWSEIDRHFSNTVLPGLLQRINEVGRSYGSIADFDRDYEIFNAFYGILFATAHSRHISDKNAYDRFRYYCVEHELRPEHFTTITDSFMPNLIFSSKAITGMSCIPSHELFVDIIGALLLLNSSNAEGWKRGYYDHKCLPVKVSGESESTMKDPKLSQMRNFTFSDGNARRCELHIKINRNAYRIHISPEKGKIYVGYIGPHLPTSNS